MTASELQSSEGQSFFSFDSHLNRLNTRRSPAQGADRWDQARQLVEGAILVAFGTGEPSQDPVAQGLTTRGNPLVEVVAENCFFFAKDSRPRVSN